MHGTYALQMSFLNKKNLKSPRGLVQLLRDGDEGLDEKKKKKIATARRRFFFRYMYFLWHTMAREGT